MNLFPWGLTYLLTHPDTKGTAATEGPALRYDVGNEPAHTKGPFPLWITVRIQKQL